MIRSLLSSRPHVRNSVLRAASLLGIVAALGTLACPELRAATPTPPESIERSFEETLNDVLTDFEIELRKGEIQGLKNVHLRSTRVAEGIPESFKTHLETLIAERILRSGVSPVVPCPACRTRQLAPDTLNNGSMVLAGPLTDRDELLKVARKAGVQSFLDIAFAYRPTGLILSLSVTALETGALTASRSYSSESSPTAARRRGAGVPEQELVMDSNPTQTRMQYRVATTFSYLPDRPGSGNLTSDTSTALGVVARGVERYDHFRKEVGFQFEYYRSGVALISPSAASSTSFWTKLNVAALFLHSWNLARYPDNPQFARGSLLLGIGGFFSPGHLAPLARTAYEWRLGRHWATALHLGYRFRSTVYSSGISVGQAGGVDSGFGIHYLF